MNNKIVSILVMTLLLGTIIVPLTGTLPASYARNITAKQNSLSRLIKTNYDYVIITTDALVNSVKTFEIWKRLCGYSVKTVTLSWITTTYPGRDSQEQIRNFLIDSYEEWGIQYVLFVGSRNTIPMREVYTIPAEFEEGYGSLFTDFYYADLSGNWDSDNDGLFGEYKQDDVDFYPEVHVGRIPCDDPERIQNITQRSKQFESDKGAWKKNVLLLGSIIYYQNMESFDHIYDRSDGATLMEECRTDIFTPKGFTCTRMYEAEGLSPSTYEYEYPLEYSTVISEWTKGYGIVNMLGHASEKSITRFVWDRDDGDNIPELEQGELSYRDFLRKSDGTRLCLEKPPIVFTSGCSQLYSANNMGRSFIENGAATAFIGSTDLALYNITKVWNDESDGGAFSLCYYFFQFFIGDNQKCGEALSNSKTFFYDHFWCTNESNYEWIWRCYSTVLGFTLYGDPALSFIHKRNEIHAEIIQQLQLYLTSHNIIPNQKAIKEELPRLRDAIIHHLSLLKIFSSKN